MEAAKLEQLRKFENGIKSFVISYYGKYLKEDALLGLNSTEIIPDSFDNSFKSANELYGYMIRNIFHSAIRLCTTKEFSFSSDNKEVIPYGSFLENGVIEFLSNEFSINSKLPIDVEEKYSNALSLATKIKDILGDRFYEMAFDSSDAVALLNEANNPELIQLSDDTEVKNHILSKNATIEEEVKENIEDVKQDMIEDMKDNVRNGDIDLFYLDGVMKIRYIASDGDIQIFDVHDPSKVSLAYKKALVNNDADPKKFFDEISAFGESSPFVKVYVKSAGLSTEEKKELNNILGEDTKKEEIKVETNETTTVTTPVKEEVKEEIKPNVEAPATEEIKENIENTTSEQTEEVIGEGDLILLSEEEYEKLCMIPINGGTLTEHQMRLLNFRDEYLAEKEGKSLKPNAPAVTENKEQGPQLGLKTKNAYGFAQKLLPGLIIVVTICFGILGGMITFKMLH